MAANTAGQQRPTSASGTSGEAGRQRRAERRGDTGVVGDLLGIPVDGDLGGVVVHRRQRVGPVDACGDRQHGAHRGRGVLDGDHRHAAVDRAGRQRESDVDPGAGQRNAQRDGVIADSSSRAPVDGCVALRFSLTCHSPGAPMRCTGLMAVRPAHSTSGESSTTASGPVTSARA